MPVKYNALVRHLQKGAFAPVYLLAGDENFLKEEVIDQLRTALVPPGMEAFNLDILYGEETDAQTILTLAESLPMLSKQRLLLVRAVEQLPRQERNALLSYLDNPNPSTCLVFTAARVDWKSKFYAACDRAGIGITLWPLYDNQILPWIQRRSARYHKRIDPEAATLLQHSVGNDLQGLANELEKLSIYVGERPSIESADVTAVVGALRANTVFDLTNAVGMRRYDQALRMLKRLLESNESPVLIVSMLVRHFTILQRVQSLAPSTRSRATLARQLRVLERFVDDYRQQAHNFTGNELNHCFAVLLKADVGLKSSSQPPLQILSMVLYQLCRRVTPAL